MKTTDGRIRARLLAPLLAGLCLGATFTAHAQTNATWNAMPTSGDFNDGANWSTGVVPTGTATFGASNISSLTVSQSTTVGALVFTSGPAVPKYTFDFPVGTLAINGSGISAGSSGPTFNVIGGSTPAMAFMGTSTAGTAIIIAGNPTTVNMGFDGGFIFFQGSSTAGQATITIRDASNLQFQNLGKAGNATITADKGGSIFFQDMSSADHAIITMLPGSAELSFSPAFFTGGTSTAGNATIVNNGGTTNFFQGSTAGDATITTNDGGLTRFFGQSTGGNAALIANGTGIVDISGLGTFPDGGGGPNVPGMTAGSIAGDGTYNLGDKELTVGSNNLSTEVSGLIEGNGGSLTKVGTGTLTLSGINTYTGPTNVNGGELLVRDPGSIAGSGDVHSGGALGGTGTIHGPVTIQDGGTLTPGVGNTPGTLTVGPLTLNPSSILNYKLGIPNGVNDLVTVSGKLTLAGKLNVTDIGGFSAGVYRLIDYTGSLTNHGLGFGLLPRGFGFSVDTSHISQVNLVVSGLLPDQFWDGSNTTPGNVTFGRGGTFTWNNIHTNWTNEPGAANARWNDGFAIFAGEKGAVTLGDNIRFTGMEFLTDGYLIQPDLSNSFRLFAAPDTIIRADAGIKATISAVIADESSSSPARLTKSDAGTLILSGDNTYTGSTIISDGTLQLGNGGTTGSILGDVTDDGTLAFNRSNTVIFPGMISGSGGVTQIGPGTVILTANNSYSGGTNLNGGILAVNSDSNLGTGPLSFDGGTLEALTAGGGIVSSKHITLAAGGGRFLADPGTDSTLSGVISGIGAFTKDGAGRLTLTGQNTYEGGTNFNGGILAVEGAAQIGTGPLTFNGGTLEDLSGRVLQETDPISLGPDGGTFGADPGSFSVLSGTIQGPGSFTKQGPGTLVLTGNNTYSGGTIIDDGTLVVGTPSAAGTLSAAQEISRALGSGDVFVLGGTLRTTSFQTGMPLQINVGGNYTQGPGGTLALGIGGLQPEQFDHVAVKGNAFLSGNLVVSSLNGFHPSTGDAFELLSTGGKVSGNFSLLDDSQFNTPATSITGQLRLIPVEVVSPNGVLLVYVKSTTPTPPTPPGPKPPIIDEIPEPLPPVNPEEPLPEEEVAQLLDPTAEQLTALFEIPFSGANTQRFNLNDRMTQIQQGSTGLISNLPPAPPPTTGKGVVEKQPVAFQPAPTNCWGVWVNGWGDFVNVDDSSLAKGYRFTTGGVSVGIDYRLTDHLAVGLFGAYAHTWTDFRPGDGDVNTGRGGLYATYWDPQGWWVNAGIWGGYNSYSTSRQALLGPANGSTSGYEFSTFGDAGYDFHCGDLTFGPIVSMQYTDVHVNGFSENGSLVPLAIHADSEDSLRTDVGGRAYYNWHLGKMLIIPSLTIAWEHEYLYSNLPITASAPELGGATATFNGPNEGHDSLLINAGAGVQWTPRISTYIGYQGQLGRDNYNANGVTGTFSFSF